MEIRTILAHVDIDTHTPEFLHAVAQLATRFDARVIAHSAASPSTAYMGFDGAASAELYAQELTDIEERLVVLEGELRAAMPSGMSVEWVSANLPPTSSLLDQAFRADIIVAQSVERDWGDASMRHLDFGHLVLSAGRPILLAGTSMNALKAQRIIIGWKDSRESRRAVSDCLPFLRLADKVWVMSVDESRDGAAKLSQDALLVWLQTHGIAAEGVVDSSNYDAAEALAEMAAREGADLVVTGGYGHTRLREWLFGGVTRGLLANAGLNRLMSN